MVSTTQSLSQIKSQEVLLCLLRVPHLQYIISLKKKTKKIFIWWLCGWKTIEAHLMAKQSITCNYIHLICIFTLYNHRHTIIINLRSIILPGGGRSSEVERSLMMRWVVGSILHGVDPLSYFSFQPVHHDWCNKGRSMCYPVCGMMHIKEPLLLIDKSSLCGGSGFPFSLSEWSLTICLTPYNRR